MKILAIESAEWLAKRGDAEVYNLSLEIQRLLERAENLSQAVELLKTQIASARIDGKKEFDADTYMKGKKK